MEKFIKNCPKIRPCGQRNRIKPIDEWKDKYAVVTLCGSTKFKDDFIRVQEELTVMGTIVISVGIFGHADNRYSDVITDEIKIMLDDMHKRKIDMADYIYVINTGGYIGSSTRSEIEYAEKTGKPVFYMIPLTNV